MKTKDVQIPNELPDFVEERDVFGLIKPKRVEDHKTMDTILHGETHSLHVKYASMTDRTIAFIVDVIVVFTILTIVNETFKAYVPNYTSTRIPEYVLAGIFWVFYCGFFESSNYQATVGKLIFKLKVIDIQGKKINFIIAVFRSIFKIILILPLAFDIWGINKDRRKQTMHDKIFDSYVIKNLKM